MTTEVSGVSRGQVSDNAQNRGLRRVNRYRDLTGLVPDDKILDLSELQERLEKLAEKENEDQVSSLELGSAHDTQLYFKPIKNGGYKTVDPTGKVTSIIHITPRMSHTDRMPHTDDDQGRAGSPILRHIRNLNSASPTSPVSQSSTSSSPDL